MTKFSEMTMFSTIIKHNSLAAAGREIGLSPASITTKLKNLEAKLEVKLLNRSTRHISLTEAGELYYKASINILNDINAIENLVQNQSNGLKGSIKISAPKDVGKNYILPIINEFSRLYPDIKLYVYLDDKVTNIQESGMDIIIRYGELDDCNLISRRLAISKRVLCVSPEYIANHG
ncbi:Putative transcriptional regulator, LysR family protein (fragment) [Photobacterium kishitanii]